MLAIIGAAGNVGYATVSALRETGTPVRAILRDPSKAARLEAIGCEIAIADLQQPAALADAMGGANAVQIVVPLRPQAADPVEDMRRSIDMRKLSARPVKIRAAAIRTATTSDEAAST